MVWHKVRSNYVNERNSVDTLALRIRNCFRLPRETMPISTNIFTKMVFKNHDKIAGAARRNVWRSVPPFETATVLERKQLQQLELLRFFQQVKQWELPVDSRFSSSSTQQVILAESSESYS